MNRNRFLSIALLLTAGAGSLRAQPVLRASASSRATTEVTLAYPRPAGAVAAMPGMAPSTAMPGMPRTSAAMPGMAPAPAPAPAAAPATPAARPLVIRIEYGQPHLRGRTLHTDSLVPYEKPWRTGANNSTTLTTDVDLVLGGAMLAKGTYVLYTIPGRAGWKLVIQRSVGQTPMQYSDSNDVARIDLRHATAAAPLETLTMWLVPSLAPGAARGELRLAWGTDVLTTDWSIR
ncbi:MAG TPA: DUF2911 domain-containing protein [Gemmatimonadaceae bacterium]|nr:DUF2911 domain-containing protein [Gemmatimonadaceae bacterium]